VAGEESGGGVGARWPSLVAGEESGGGVGAR